MHYIRALREQAGLTQAQVIRGYSGKMTIPLFSMIEHGIVPAPPELEQYALDMIARQRVQIDLSGYHKENTRFINAEKHILPHIGTGRENATRRIFLRSMSGMKDRVMRNGIALLREEYPILNFQDGRGYYLSYDPAELMQYRNQEMHRIQSAFAALRGIDKVLEGRK